MTPKEKANKIIEYRAVIDALELEISVLGQSILDDICPYKIGDKIPTKDFSYKNKTGEVTKIWLSHSISGFKSERKFDIHVAAMILKKDGTHSSNGVNWKSWTDDNLKFALEQLNTGR